MTIVRYILIIIFLASGAAKLAGLEFEMVAFERWGYGIEFMYFTGVVEVLGALALLDASLQKYAAVGLSAVMIGAMGTHIIHQEWPMLVAATIIFSMAVILSKSYWFSQEVESISAS